jgi:hypothetical protein
MKKKNAQIQSLYPLEQIWGHYKAFYLAAKKD